MDRETAHPLDALMSGDGLDAGKVDEFIRKLFSSLVLATKASNAVLSSDVSGSEYAFLSSFPEFASAAKNSGHAVVRMLMRIMECIGRTQPMELPEDMLDPSLYEFVVDAIDGLLEEADMFLDEAQGKKSHDEVFRVIGAVLRHDKDRVIRESTKDIEKPQLKFSSEIRNGRTEPFSFVLDSKPHGLVPPIHALLPVERMDTSIVGPAYYMPHQYEREIQSLEYNGWQLQSPDVPTAPAGWSDENFRFIDTADALQEFVAHLQQKIEDGDVREIAVDLEAHSVRSFQGLTCLMQISTRDVDVIIDVLKLRVESRALLGVFVDPRVVKVMHGAECDVLWLQRDLHIYIVNLFDTFQAAKLMRYPALSLAHLLKYHCGVSVNKKHQLSDWRERPLPEDMLMYARQDTHYLLFVYDKLLKELHATHAVNGVISVLDTCKRVCLHRYEVDVFQPLGYKRLIDDIRKKQHTRQEVWTSEKEYVLARLWDWRDQRARDLDESITYVMSTAEMLRIALRCPVTNAELLRCGPLSACVKERLQEVIGIVKGTLQAVPAQVPQEKSIGPSHVSRSAQADPTHQSYESRASSSLNSRLKSHTHNSMVSFTLAAPYVPGTHSLTRESPSPNTLNPSPVLGTEDIYALAGWNLPPKSFGDDDARYGHSLGEDVTFVTVRARIAGDKRYQDAQRELSAQLMHSHEEYFVMDREGSIQNSADNQASDAQSSEQTRGAQDADETGELEDDPFLDQVPQSMAEIYKLSNRTRKKYKDRKRAKDSIGSNSSQEIEVLDVSGGAARDDNTMDPQIMDSYFSRTDDSRSRTLESSVEFAQQIGWLNEADVGAVMADVCADQNAGDCSSDGSEGQAHSHAHSHGQRLSTGSGKHSKGPDRDRRSSKESTGSRNAGDSRAAPASARDKDKERDRRLVGGRADKKPRGQQASVRGGTANTGAGAEFSYGAASSIRSMGVLGAGDDRTSAITQDSKRGHAQTHPHYNPFMGNPRPAQPYTQPHGREQRTAHSSGGRVDQRDRNRSMTYGSRNA